MITHWLNQWVVPDLTPDWFGSNQVKLDVPGYCQTDGYSCGAVTSYAIIRTFHPKARFRDVRAYARPHQETGMSPWKVMTTLRHFGVGVSYRRNLTFHSMRAALDQGFPLALWITTKTPGIAHWVVVYGYGLKPNRIFVAGQIRPGFSREEFTWPEFRARWSEPGHALVCWGKSWPTGRSLARTRPRVGCGIK